MFGLRTEPCIAIQRAQHRADTIAMRSPWGWSDSISSWTWPGYEGTSVIAEVYSDAHEITLVLNGEEIARGAVGEDKPMMASFAIPYRPGVLEAIALREGIEIGRTRLHTASASPRLTATADRCDVRRDDDDLAFVSIELRDENGILRTHADREVTVEVTGAGVLAGMCSANPKTEERFDSSTWRNFDGRALAVIRPTGPGRVRVSVVSDGLDAATVSLDVTGDGAAADQFASGGASAAPSDRP